MSGLDFLTALCKQGIPIEEALVTNNLWLRCGLTKILLGPKYYALRVIEET